MWFDHAFGPLHLVRSLIWAAATFLLGSAAWAQSEAEIQFARAFLADLQEISIRENREYCGLFGYDSDGNIIATKARRGRRASCVPRDPPYELEVFASYHTHAGFDERYDGEVPSAGDVESDRDEGIDGYVSTPAGRVWFINGRRAETRLICGPHCVPFDPRDDPEAYAPVGSHYTLRALKRREEEQ